MAIFKKLKVDQYFLTREPFSRKPRINVKVVAWVVGVSAVLFVTVVLVLGSGAERAEKERWLATKEGQGETDKSETNGPPLYSESGVSPRAMERERSSRQYSASQVVRSSAGLGGGLPIGTVLPAKLVNTLLSSDAGQPAMAELPKGGAFRNAVIIPPGTKAIGSATFDDRAKRLQIRFHTLVYPEGDEHPISAVALLPDGSSGLTGDYHSGTAEKEAGRFLGNFVGGLAEGMKDRQAGGQAGIPFEPGSIKNGLLNGITASAFDRAKVLTEQMQSPRSFLEVPAGSPFVLFVEKEFVP